MTKPWYEMAFGADYLERYAHRDLSEARATIERLFATINPSSGSHVLDLCCGGGRHSVVMAEQGMEVVGLDLSADLVREAMRLAAHTPGASFVRADKRAIPLRTKSVDLVTHFFTAFGYFETDAENYSVFSEVARVLRPGGVYVFDFLNARAVEGQVAGEVDKWTRERLVDGTISQARRRLLGSPGSLRVEKHVQLLSGTQIVRELREQVRLFTPEELRVALEERGFRSESVWGNYDGSPFFEGTSPRWLAICRRWT